jgi:Flp pilus assembly pilin Flp
MCIFYCLKTMLCSDAVKQGQDSQNAFNVAQIVPDSAGYIQPYRDGTGPRREAARNGRSGWEPKRNHPLEGPTMFNFINKFRNDEEGAVTVDWVVLTAAIVGLGVAAISTVEGGVGTLAGNIKTNVESTTEGDEEFDTGN